MLFNYLKITLRTFFKNKVSTFINLLGFSAGIVTAFLIFIYVSFELSYDDYHDDIDLKFSIIQHKDLNSEETKSLINRTVSEDASTPFDLDRGPLIRATIIEIANQSVYHNYVVLTSHHIVCDGWSLDVIILDISNFYNLLESISYSVN